MFAGEALSHENDFLSRASGLSRSAVWSCSTPMHNSAPKPRSMSVIKIKDDLVVIHNDAVQATRQR
jgi:hypothetical protein